MVKKHKAGLKAKAKEASPSTIAKGSSKKRSASGNPCEQVTKKGKPTSSASTARTRAVPI
jgi:hypothetical protein